MWGFKKMMEADSVWVIQARISFSLSLYWLSLYFYIFTSQMQVWVYNLHRLVSIEEGKPSRVFQEHSLERLGTSAANPPYSLDVPVTW